MHQHIFKRDTRYLNWRMRILQLAKDEVFHGRINHFKREKSILEEIETKFIVVEDQDADKLKKSFRNNVA